MYTQVDSNVQNRKNIQYMMHLKILMSNVTTPHEILSSLKRMTYSKCKLRTSLSFLKENKIGDKWGFLERKEFLKITFLENSEMRVDRSILTFY